MVKKKVKSKILLRTCAICGREIKVALYSDGAYRGGHYFGKLTPKKLEYWECPKCYW
jgi:DNA-directed RNA polymerase subunit RPC12/RpoP